MASIKEVNESVRTRSLKLVADRDFPGWREEAPIHPLKGDTVERPGTDKKINSCKPAAWGQLETGH